MPAQSDFYSTACGKLLRDLVRDAENPAAVAHLLKVWQQKLSYRLVRTAEESKIALSDRPDFAAALDFISADLQADISVAILQDAISQPLEKILEQVHLALATSHIKPEVIYLTGGSARSPLLRAALQQALPGTPIAGGDDFASVTAGLARWAEVMFA